MSYSLTLDVSSHQDLYDRLLSIINWHEVWWQAETDEPIDEPCDEKLLYHDILCAFNKSELSPVNRGYSLLEWHTDRVKLLAPDVHVEITFTSTKLILIINEQHGWQMPKHFNMGHTLIAVGW